MVIPAGVSGELMKGVTKTALSLMVAYIKKRMPKSSYSSRVDLQEISEGIEKHLVEVGNWNNQIQFLGMSNPRGLDKLTVSLDMQTEARRFKGKTQQNKAKTEKDLLADAEHYVLLGEPGSGKTTTLKRLSRILLTKPPRSKKDIYQYPLVIRLRELFHGSSLFTAIADILHIKYAQIEVKKTIKLKNAASFDIKIIETRVGDLLIEEVLADVLNNTDAVLILDGLDEIKADYRDPIRKEIILLSRKLKTSKIIISLRSGEYDVDIEGFNILEICPLTQKQIKEIASKWLPNPEAFMDSLHALPYYDIADRPLLLTQLLFIFKHQGDLPEQPAVIYRKVVRLLLEEWDSQRAIVRGSKYAGFDTERKIDFLAAIAYHLTYSLDEKRFSEESMVKAYLKIYKAYNLPENEARTVVKEMQSHTGIIIAAPMDAYEFSHLSLQEYFCGYYLVRTPMTTELITYMASYVAPLAVAVVLSSTPGQYFAKIILDNINRKIFTAQGLYSFLTRIIIERPYFEVSEPLAFAIFHLSDIYNETDVRDKLYELMKIPTVLESISSAMRWYAVRESNRVHNSNLDLRLKDGLVNNYNIDIPKYGSLPKKIYSDIIKMNA